MKKSLAFTLAEVLITLGIVGVIAAISIPMLITATQKKVAETKLKHFYSEINNVMRLSANDNGVDIDGWVVRDKSYNEAELRDLINTYFAPYLKISYMKPVEKNPNSSAQCRMLVVLHNSTAFSIYVDANGGDIFFHPDPSKYDFANPRHSFAFQMTKTATDFGDDRLNNFNSVSFVQPYILNWDGTKNMLKNDSRFGCNRTSRSKQYCTKYIEMNDWKIPWDYPW